MREQKSRNSRSKKSFNSSSRSNNHSSLITHHSSPSQGRLDKTFERLKAKGEKALITYLMAGDPSLGETEQLVVELERAGADIVELGVPFSDPIADGPVIQQAAERALRSGTTLRGILDMVRHLRIQSEVPLVLMTYYNSIHAFGPERFCREAVAAGEATSGTTGAASGWDPIADATALSSGRAALMIGLGATAAGAD